MGTGMDMDAGREGDGGWNRGMGATPDLLEGNGGAGLSERERALFTRRVDDALTRLEQSMSGSREHESLAEEIEALRLVLARLLAEEDDPARLASSIPRVVDAVVRAIRTQRALSGALAESLTEGVTQILIELGLDKPR